ncbi:hypothetical protein, partial [Azohydromonas lata]|uniref:hypothetical protein n=1 Tax=Azohydromonas lata TaxID=45677 RepID=UPI001C3F2E17
MPRAVDRLSRAGASARCATARLVLAPQAPRHLVPRAVVRLSRAGASACCVAARLVLALQAPRRTNACPGRLTGSAGPAP